MLPNFLGKTSNDSPMRRRKPVNVRSGETQEFHTDALLNLGRGHADGLAKFLQRDPLISFYACEVFVNCFGFLRGRRHRSSKKQLGRVILFPAESLAVLSHYFRSYASFRIVMSIFCISSIAFITRSDFSEFLSCNISIKIVGTICHDTPNLSFSQPQCDSCPPSAVSFSQK